jgi:hypothetical protein
MQRNARPLKKNFASLKTMKRKWTYSVNFSNFLVIVPLTVAVTDAGPQDVLEATIGILVYLVTYYGNGPTRDCYPV